MYVSVFMYMVQEELSWKSVSLPETHTCVLLFLPSDQQPQFEHILMEPGVLPQNDLWRIRM